MLLASCANEKTAAVNKDDEAVATRIFLSDEQLKATPVDTISLERKNLPATIRLTGKVAVNPDDLVSLSSALGGRVQSVNALPGKTVRKGDVIVVLEDQQFIEIQQDYLTTKARLLSAAPDYIRQKELNASKSASDKALQQAETEYRALLAARSALEEKLHLINIDPAALTSETIRRSIQILAPFDGVIRSVLVNKGKYVAPSDVLAELINPEGLLLNIRVFEKDWSKVAIGQLVEAHTNQEPHRRFQAKIITTGQAINEDGSAEIIARPVSPNAVKLVSGLYVNALLEVGNTETFSLPEEAVVSFEGKNYVFEFLDRNTFQLQEVAIGKIAEGIAEITDYQSLKGKKLVGKGAYTLLMALKNKSDD